MRLPNGGKATTEMASSLTFSAGQSNRWLASSQTQALSLTG
jgi:hypothetical protein